MTFMQSFFLYVYVFQTFKTKLHLCIKQRFKMQAKRVRRECYVMNLTLARMLGETLVLWAE